MLPLPASGLPEPGAFLINEGVVLNLKGDQNIGRFYRRCILPPAFYLEQTYDYECLRTFSLSLQGRRPGQIMLQGSFNYQTATGVDDQAGIPLPPEQQYVVIAGGTGCFRSLVGVAKIQVQGDFISSPLLLRYTFYIDRRLVLLNT